MVEVRITDQFEDWYRDLDEADQVAIARIVGLLEVRGVTLGEQYSSAIKGSRHALRELRVMSRGRPFRVFYAFDPKRRAVLLIGGDKGGDKRFYEVYVPMADQLFDEYLVETADEDDNPEEG